MMGLDEIREANERATDVAFLRERISKALEYLDVAATDAPEDTSIMATTLVLAAALEGRTIEEEGKE